MTFKALFGSQRLRSIFHARLRQAAVYGHSFLNNGIGHVSSHVRGHATGHVTVHCPGPVPDHVQLMKGMTRQRVFLFFLSSR